MKVRHYITVAVFAASLSTIAVAQQNPSANPNQTMQPSTSMQSNKPSTMNANQMHHDNDGTILQTVITLDKGEVSAASAVLKKHISHDVKKFAQLMVKEHSNNLQKAYSLKHKTGAVLKSNPDSIALEKQNAEELAKLKATPAHDVNTVYINDMVKDHQNALNLLDKLMSNATDPMLKKFIADTRKHVEEHLKKAEELQKKPAA